MLRWRTTTGCERAAEWISLDLDGELGEFEQVALGRHLDRCPGCRAANAGIAAFTTLIRMAPLDEPAREIVVVSPGRAKRIAWRVAIGAIAATAAVVAFVAPPNPGTAPASSLSFRNADEQVRFAEDHNRPEQNSFVVAETAPARAIDLRALR